MKQFNEANMGEHADNLIDTVTNRPPPVAVKICIDCQRYIEIIDPKEDGGCLVRLVCERNWEVVQLKQQLKDKKGAK